MSNASDNIPVAEPGWFARITVALFGIVLPLAALGFEMLTGACAEIFDPIPTLAHVGAILWVPVAHACGLLVLLGRGRARSHAGAALRMNAVAIGVAVFYSVWFAPLTPFAVVASIFGIGLLPLAPLLSGIVGLFLRGRLRASVQATGAKAPRFWLWWAVGFVALAGLEIPPVAQTWASAAVARGNDEQQARGLWLLREFVPEQDLLRACSIRHDNFRDELHRAAFGELTSEQRRRIYFRVTGRSAFELPRARRWRFSEAWSRRDGAGDWVFDDAQGGTAVGRHLRHLDLAESRMDASVNGDAVTGYAEWTLVFRNQHEFLQREARALIQLPAGGVVSRLTLWIDGEEREAAFGGRAQTRQAYQAVVNQRRDPVLVTARGADRVLLQCFPVPAKGGEMKVRIGVTFPLVLDSPETARFAWPRIIDRNFGVADDFKDVVWVESRQELTSPLAGFRREPTADGRSVFHGILTEADFNSPRATLTVGRARAVDRAWSRISTAGPEEANIVLQTLTRQAPPPGPIVVVLDGSRALAPVANELAGLLTKLPATCPLQLIVGGDRVMTCPVTTPHEAALWLRAQTFAGGQDSTDALAAAIRQVDPQPGTVLWIHGAQAESWQNFSVVEQRLARRRSALKVYAFAAVAGPNVVLDRVAEYRGTTALPRLGSVRDDLSRTFDWLQNGAWAAGRRLVPLTAGIDGAVEGSQHLARLWAADEVARLAASGPAHHGAAVALAQKMQLVTAVTSAVVLETTQQYQAAGLEPVDPATVPTVPDTGRTLILLAGGIAAMICFARLRSRRTARAALVRPLSPLRDTLRPM